MNLTLCDRCGCTISRGNAIRAFQWNRVQPNGNAFTYDLCGGCDTATVEGIQDWDDSVRCEPTRT